MRRSQDHRIAAAAHQATPPEARQCDRIVAMARGEVLLDRPVAQTSIEEVTDLL
jgi:hypothetical protein